jgi:ABC-type Na+ efflux pump permease subunit
MLLILVANYALWSGIFVLSVVAISTIASTPELVGLLEQRGRALGICDGDSAVEAMLRISTSTNGAVLFTNLPLFVAIMSGYSVLHDRTHGTLPFLMLAPLSRFQLLLGKLLGALAIPAALHIVFVGTVTIIVRQFDVMAPFSAKLAGSPAWWAAFLFGAPASALLVGALGTVISGLSRDVRTSMQFTSFFIGLLSLGFGFVLFDGIEQGLPTQLGFIVAACTLALIVLFAGSRIISRDVWA